MKETYAEIQETLEELGEVLTLSAGTLYGILEIERTFLEGQSSFSSVEAIEFNYIVSTQDYATLLITTGTTFTNTDGIFTYTFEVAREAAHTSDGWSRMACNLTGKVAA